MYVKVRFSHQVLRVPKIADWTVFEPNFVRSAALFGCFGGPLDTLDATQFNPMVARITPAVIRVSPTDTLLSPMAIRLSPMGTPVSPDGHSRIPVAIRLSPMGTRLAP